MSEVPRHWRLKKQRYSPSGSECGNCGDKAMEIGRPVCRRCGLVFEPENVTKTTDQTVNRHKVIGRSMRVYFVSPLAEKDRPIPIDLRLRIDSKEESRV